MDSPLDCDGGQLPYTRVKGAAMTMLASDTIAVVAFWRAL